MDVWSLGIDLGTANTTAAVADAVGIRVLAIEHAPVMPSLVCVDVDGDLLVGRQAAALTAQFPERVVVPKRALVAGPDVPMGGTSVRATDLAAAVLSKAADEASRQHEGTIPRDVVVTHPVRWGDHELAALRRAADAAGLPQAELLPEPLAAARHFMTAHHLAVGQYLAVYDLGAATLDIAIVQRTEDGLVLAGPPGGDASFGGDELDAAMRQLLPRVTVAAPVAWPGNWTGDGRTAARIQADWRRSVTLAREALSDQASVAVDQEGYDEATIVGRTVYEEAVGPALRESVAELEATLERAGLTPADLSAVYLVGGASRTPLIAALITEALGIAPTTADDPTAAVALGALTPRSAQDSFVSEAATAPLPPADAVPLAPTPSADGRAARGASHGRRSPWAGATNRSLALMAVGVVLVVVLATIGIVFLTSARSTSAASTVPPPPAQPSAAPPTQTAGAASPPPASTATLAPPAHPLPPAPSPTGLQAALAGTWRGVEQQSNLATPVPVTLVLTPPSGTAAYGNPVSCQDVLALTSTDATTTATFTQTTTTPACLARVTVKVSPLPNGQLAYTFTGDAVTGTGTLTRS